MSPLVLAVGKAPFLKSDELFIIGQFEGETRHPLVQIMQRDLAWCGEHGGIWTS